MNPQTTMRPDLFTQLVTEWGIRLIEDAKKNGCDGKPELKSQSPVNTRRMGGQNLRLFNYLMTGQRINVFSKAKHELRIGYLNSRCSDLINVHRIDVQSEYVSVKDIDGADVQVKEYWMNQEEINRLKRMGK